MQLLVIRHAIAEEAGPDDSDAERRLTSVGAKKMRRGARGLRRVVQAVDMLVSSPLVRALETAEIVAETYDGMEVSESVALAPGAPPEAVAAWMGKEPLHGVVALVGHEPGLSRLVTWLLSGELRSAIELKKGAACLLECPRDMEAGSATLLWALRPRHLRRLR